MRKFTLVIVFTFLLASFQIAKAQLNLPQSSPKSTTIQKIGIVEASITYSRPAVKDREIWGKIVPYGFTDPGFGTSKSAPWRAGADENTLISFSDEVMVEGKMLKAGTYGLHMAIEESGEVTIIFSHNTTSWGSYFYDEKEDALRVKVKWQDAAHQEQLLYTFDKVTPSSAEIALLWEKKRIPFNVKIENAQEKVVQSLEAQLRSNTGFYYQSWMTAASYCLQNNIALDKALLWAESAISMPYIGQKNASTLGLKAKILEKMGKTEEAKAVLKEIEAMKK